MNFIKSICIFVIVAFVGISTFAQQDRPMSDLEREVWWALSSISSSPEDIISLLEKGVDPNAVITERRGGMTLFHFAVNYSNSLPVIRAFLEHGANINTTRKLFTGLNFETILAVETAFDSAILSNGNSAIIKLLSENGATTNYSPLHVAVRLEDVEAVRDLLENEADPNATDRLGLGLTPLLLAVEFSENLAITEMLLDYGADPNAAPHPYTASKTYP